MDLITTPVVFGQSPPENSILHSTSVSFTGRSPSEPVHIVQYDLTIPVIAISLTANGQPYTVPSGAAVNIRLAKPDGHYVYDPAYGVSDDGQTVYIAVTGQMTVAAGKVQPVIEVVVDGGTAATGSFTLVIDKNPVPDSALQSSDEYLTMQQILAEVQAAAQLVEENQENLQNLTDNLEAVQNAAANAQAATASAAAAQQSAEEAAQSAQQSLGFRTFFSAIMPDANGNLDPSRPMTTPSAQPSWTIESKGDRIQSVQVDGFTTQAGTGDASPVNVREISTAGLRMVASTLDGSADEGWANFSTTAGVFYCDIPIDPAGLSDSLIFSSRLKLILSGTSAALTTKELLVQHPSGALRVIIRINATTTSVQDCRDALQASPLTIWYVPADESKATGLYIPVQAQGHEYRCQCLPLTEALASGDDVQSAAPSGCDKAIMLDGSTVQVTQSGSAYVATAENAVAGGAVYANSLANLSLLAGQVSIPSASFPDTVTSAQTANEWLQDNPQAVYYQSIAYTEQTDNPVELETHASGNIYAHQAVDLVAVPYTQADVDVANQLASAPSTLPAIDSPDVPMLLDATDPEQTAQASLTANAIPVVGTYVVSSQDGTAVAVSLKPFQDGGDAATVGGYTAQELIAGSGNVDAATLNGKTAQQILQSAESTAQGYTQSYTQSYVQQQMQNVYTKAQTQQIVPFLYKATFDVGGWSSSGSGYTQTVAVTPVDGGPSITAQSIMTSAVTVDDTVQGSAGDELDAAAAIVNGGAKTFGPGTITCVIQGAAPTADAEVFFNASGGGN